MPSRLLPRGMTRRLIGWGALAGGVAGLAVGAVIGASAGLTGNATAAIPALVLGPLLGTLAAAPLSVTVALASRHWLSIRLHGAHTPEAVAAALGSLGRRTLSFLTYVVVLGGAIAGWDSDAAGKAAFVASVAVAFVAALATLHRGQRSVGAWYVHAANGPRTP